MANSSTLLILGLTANTANDLTAVTYNGVAGNLVTFISFDSGTLWTYMYYWVNPASGSHSFNITSTSNHYLIGVCAEYTGTPSTTPVSDFTTLAQTVTDNAVPITNTSGNAWAVMVCGKHFTGGAAVGAGANTTLRYRDATFDDVSLLDSNGPLGKGTQTLHSTTGSSEIWGTVLATFRDASNRPGNLFRNVSVGGGTSRSDSAT